MQDGVTMDNLKIVSAFKYDDEIIKELNTSSVSDISSDENELQQPSDVPEKSQSESVVQDAQPDASKTPARPKSDPKNILILGAVIAAVFVSGVVVTLAVTRPSSSPVKSESSVKAEESTVSEDPVITGNGFTFDNTTNTFTVTSDDFDFMGIETEFNGHITSVVFKPGLKKINSGAIGSAETIKNVSIPDSITRIEEFSFSGCENLTSVKLSDNVVFIGKQAFKYCRSITSITIPESVTDMESEVFDGRGSDQTIYIKGRSSAPSGWNEDRNADCDAKIVWNA